MFPLKIRVALWRANDCRCFYCTEPVSFRDLEIDHVVPEHLEPKLDQVRLELGLPPDFVLGSLPNLVPTHHNCNRRKAGAAFDKGATLYFLELWARRQDRVQAEIDTQKRAAARDRHLIAISALIESGDISLEELWRILSKVRPAAEPKPQDPLVITFGTDVGELLSTGVLPQNASETYAAACEWLENDLLFGFSESLPMLAHRTESERNGETLSVRVAFWNLDLDQVEQWKLPYWTILEIANFSDVYPDSSPVELLEMAVVKASGRIVSDPWDTAFGIGRCPRCGWGELKRYSTTDHRHDDTYHTVECPKCGWLEWTTG